MPSLEVVGGSVTASGRQTLACRRVGRWLNVNPFGSQAVAAQFWQFPVHFDERRVFYCFLRLLGNWISDVSFEQSTLRKKQMLICESILIRRTWDLILRAGQTLQIINRKWGILWSSPSYGTALPLDLTRFINTKTKEKEKDTDRDRDKDNDKKET